MMVYIGTAWCHFLQDFFCDSSILFCLSPTPTTYHTYVLHYTTRTQWKRSEVTVETVEP